MQTGDAAHHCVLLQNRTQMRHLSGRGAPAIVVS